MEKAQIIETIIDFIDAPYEESPESFDDITEINLEEAAQYLKDYIQDARCCDDDNAVTAFTEATPEVFLEAWNKLCSDHRRRLITDNLADYITESECVCEYDQFCADYQKDPPRALPVEFLDISDIASFPFHTATQLTVADLIQIGINSAGNNLDHTYAYFNEETMSLYSTDTPFEDGILDARGFAEFLLGNRDALVQFFNSMDDDEIMKVFGMSESEVLSHTGTVYAVSFMHNDDNPWDETIECSSTEEVADLIEQKLSDNHTLVSEFVKKEALVW